MKKILTLAAAVLGVAFGAQAQRTANIEGHLVTPADPTTATTLGCTDSIRVTYYYINNGPDDIYPTDTMAFIDAATNPYNSAYRVVPTDTIHQNDTIFKVDDFYRLADVDFLWHTDGSADTTKPFNGDFLFPAKFFFYGWSVESTAVTQDDETGNEIPFLLTVNCNTTGLNGLTKNNSTLRVFPNPAYNTISFTNDFATTTAASVRITDVAGRVVKSMDLGKQNAGAKTFNVDIADLHNGMYYIEVVTETTRSINKFIKN